MASLPDISSVVLATVPPIPILPVCHIFNLVFWSVLSSMCGYDKSSIPVTMSPLLFVWEEPADNGPQESFNPNPSKICFSEFHLMYPCSVTEFAAGLWLVVPLGI